MDRFADSSAPSARMSRPGVVMTMLTGLLAWTAASSAEDSPRFKRGLAFRQELSRPVNLYVRAVTVREMVRRIERLHHVAILLDRRIDPDRVLDVQLSQTSLEEGLEEFAHQLDADAAVIGSTVLIGPARNVDRIRTEIAQQVAFLRSLPDEATRERTFSMLLGDNFRWQDLDTPRELVLSVAERFGVSITNLEMVPHDLWGGGAMIDVSAPEALAMVAGQFDLMIAWNDDVSLLTLSPAPERLTIDESLEVHADNLVAAIAAAREACPLAEFRQEGRTVHVVGTVGELEQIAAILDPERKDSRSTAPDLGPLTQRRFTLTTQRASAIAVLRTLEAQGVSIEFEQQVIREAGIDLSQKVSLMLQDATADEFFHALCDPLGLQFDIEGTTVRLMPR